MLNEPHVENIVLVKQCSSQEPDWEESSVKHTGHRKKDQIKKKKFCSDLKKITSESPAKTHPRRTITEQKQPDKSLTRVCSLETDKTSTFLVTEMLSVC